MKNVIVTGSESFVGRELIAQYLSQGINVVGLDIVSPASPQYEFHAVNIGSKEVVNFIPENADAIVHLAALSRDVDCKNNAYKCFDANVMGTLNLINVAKEKKVKSFIFASSEWVYNDCRNNEEQTEETLIDISKHTSEYALSKLVSEANLRQQHNNGFCNVTILRFAIIYGPRKNNWSAVESLFSAVKNQNEVTVRSLKNGRRFIHVSDIANGIIQSIPLAGFNIINLSGDKIITMGDILETSQKILNKKIKIIETNPSEKNIRNPANTRAKNILSWSPKINLESGLRTLLPFV